MTDRYDDDDDDEQEPVDAPPPARPEGVRILGAEEAQAALEGDSGRLPADRPRFGDRPARPDPTVRPSLSFPLPEDRPARFGDAGPTWSASTGGPADAGDAPPGDEPPAEEPPAGESDAAPPLPHWTEPPSGAVPAIFADSDEESGGEDLDAWASLSGQQPRFRAEGSDWADADFAAGELTDEGTRVGALAPPEPEVDDDAAFAEEVAARRRVRRPPAERRAGPRRPAAPRPEVDTEAFPSGRDLPTALATAAVIVAVAFFCFSQGTTWTAWLAAAIVGLATLEFANGLRAKGLRPAALLALLASVGIVPAAKEYGVSAYPVFFALVAAFSLLWYLWQVAPGRPLVGTASTVLSFAYVGGFGGFAGLLLQSRDGVGLLLGATICAVAYDVFGYFVGSQFGKSHIAPRVSPNKTFEGTLAGMTASVLLGWALVGRIEPWNSTRGLSLGLLLAAGAFLGDLCESMLKRDLGIKDFGGMLPGHGGVLDRFDGLLFCLPITYYLALHLDIL